MPTPPPRRHSSPPWAASPPSHAAPLAQFAIPCRIALVVYFGWTIDALNNAARQNQCLGFGHEYWMLLSAVWYPYIDRGGWCNNN